MAAAYVNHSDQGQRPDQGPQLAQTPKALSVFRQLIPIRELFFAQHQTDDALRLLKPIMTNNTLSPQEQRACLELAALIYRHQKHFDLAQDCYATLDAPYQYGYCYMLQGKVEKAKPHWAKVVQTRENHWCQTLLGVLTQTVVGYPTLLQVRQHFEADLANIIFNCQWGYLNALLTAVDWLNECNPETYKFAGRTLMHCGLLDQAEPYLLEAQKTLPNDAEAYFHLGQFYWLQGAPSNAAILLNQCLLISPTYTPAHHLLAAI